MKRFLIKLFFILTILSLSVSADVKLIKKENPDSNTTLLVIGGVHGDEPGGYFSASILATHYKIKSKNLWIVPNLNEPSIQNNSRGINGDMNRKFSTIKNGDKDKKTVENIKKIILEKNVSLVLNLHDGNGFYRKTDKGSIFNPNAWGQTCVIDQCVLSKDQPFGDLNNIALNVKERINKKLIEAHHTFDVKNTNTKFEDEAMQLSLTYFAVTNNKPAFAIESSKNLPSLPQKVFYHLLAIEEFMNIMGISFSREFELNEKNIKKIIQDYGTLNINNNFIVNLSDIRESLSYVPLKLQGNSFTFSSPLGNFSKKGSSYAIYVGNQLITSLKPQYFKMKEKCEKKFKAVIDGKSVSLDRTSNIIVKDSFSIVEQKGHRVNIIGFKAKDSVDESGINIKLKDFDKRFSIDEKGLAYRVEFYKNDDFCSMSGIYFKKE